MPDASGGIGSALWWVATGQAPMESLEEGKQPKEVKSGKPSDEQLAEQADSFYKEWEGKRSKGGSG